MGQARKPAMDGAMWRSKVSLWIDNAFLVKEDFEHLAEIEKLTLWNVTFPQSLLGKLPELQWLDIRGGTLRNLDFLNEVNNLRYLQLNQIRGVTELSNLARLETLELLSLFGLSKVASLPSFANLESLKRAEIGQMKSLENLSGLHLAPQLKEPLFTKNVSVSKEDVENFNNHPNLEHFYWDIYRLFQQNVTNLS